MRPDAQKLLLLSDFNLDSFKGLLNRHIANLNLEVIAGPYGQVLDVLSAREHEVWERTPEVAFVWTRPESVIPAFRAAREFRFSEISSILGEVDRFADAIKKAAERTRLLLVADWVMPPFDRGTGMLDLTPGTGIRDALRRMNLRLAERLSDIPNTFLLDSSHWLMSAGLRPVDMKLWYMGKIAFSSEVLSEAASDVASAVAGFRGQARKLVIVDLDDTLWGGIVGDDGWENLRLGGHDFLGEAYADFQRALKALTNRGILLGIVSKNEEETALEAIRKHPEMILNLDDFAGWRINWDDKAKNVAALVEELNLGLQSTVFIDDNPVERDRVKEALPEVFVPNWPDDKLRFTETLLSLRCFDTPSISTEDRARAQMYVTERKRKQVQVDTGSLSDWLNSLEIQAKIEPLNAANLQRTVQLLNKTNQMNLSTRRLTEAELTDWVAKPGHALWTFRVADKFGDSGLTGILSTAIEGKEAKIVDYVLSCRVMGRKIEETMLAHACQYAKSKRCDTIFADYVATPKNKPMLDFLRKSGFEPGSGGNRFVWNLDKPYTYPREIQVKVHE